MMKIHLRTMCALMIVSATAVTMTSAVYAEEADSHSVSKVSKPEKKVVKKAKAGAKTSAGSGSSVAGQTDIVAKVDLPMVTNITPWRDAEESAPKNILEFSALKDSLTPTDRDRLAGEIRYTSILNQPVEQK